MATTRDIVTRAFRKVGIIAFDEDMTAEEAALGIAALNDMMHAMELEGINLAHSDLDLSDPFPLESRFHEGIVYMLARRVSPDFNRPGIDDDRFRRMLQAAFAIVPEVASPTALRYTPSQLRTQRDFD